MSLGARPVSSARRDWVQLEVKVLPSRCLHVSAEWRLQSLAEFAGTVSRPWRAFQPTLKQTTRSDCVQVSAVASSFQDSKSPVLNLQLSGDVQPTPGHLKWHQTSLSNWTEPLMLGHLSGPLWQEWQTPLTTNQAQPAISHVDNSMQMSVFA